MEENMNPTQEPSNNQPNNKKSFIMILVIVIVLLGAYYIFQQKDGSESVNNQSETTTPINEDNEDDGFVLTGETKTFTVDANNFTFSQKEIKVKRGDKVKIIFNNKEGFHDWVIDEFDARTPQLGVNEVSEIEFIADKIGTFEYYCSVGQHRAMGMVGNLIVE